jgi:protease I
MTSSKNILMVIAPQDFRDEEFFEPYQHFTQERQWSVTVASTQTGLAKGMLGKSVDVTQTLESQNASQFDALVVVGGMGSPEYLWENETLRTLTQDFARQSKVISAICLSGVVLAKAGVLDGKKATVWEMPESVAEFEKAGAHYIKQDVVVDGSIVTSNGPHAATPFAHEVANQLSKVPA